MTKMIGLPWRAVQCSDWRGSFILAGLLLPALFAGFALFSGPEAYLRTVLQPDAAFHDNLIASFHIARDLGDVVIAHAHGHLLRMSHHVGANHRHLSPAFLRWENRGRGHNQRIRDLARRNGYVDGTARPELLAGVRRLHPYLDGRALRIHRRADHGHLALHHRGTVRSGDRRGLPYLHECRLRLRHVDARDHTGNIDDGEQGRTGVSRLAGEQGTVGDNPRYRAANFRITHLRLRRFVPALRRFHLACRRLDLFMTADLLKRFQVRLRGLVLASGLCVGHGRLIDQASGERALLV